MTFTCLLYVLKMRKVRTPPSYMECLMWHHENINQEGKNKWETRENEDDEMCKIKVTIRTFFHDSILYLHARYWRWQWGEKKQVYEGSDKNWENIPIETHEI